MRRDRNQSLKLKSGSRIAVIGGGPAGSLFSICLLRFAQEQGLAVEVTVYQEKSFAEPGPRGCSRCAGILSASLLRNLSELQLELPGSVVQGHIRSYRLHSPFGTMEIHNPEPEGEIYSVFRGGGPLRLPLGAAASFDNFLLQQALAQGAKLIRGRVDAIIWNPRRALRIGEELIEYDLIVLACGVNTPPINLSSGSYILPRTHLMAQDELHARPEDIKEKLGTAVQVFLFPKSDLVFGTLVPKGQFINVSLLSKGVPPEVKDFLANELVRKVLSFPYQSSCGCRPRIAVRWGKNFWGDGFVAVGDASVTRLYKDGLGTALLTAREAARTAVFQGISREDFAHHYVPFCRALNRDNSYGRLLFGLHNRVKDSPSLFAASSHLAAAETEFQDSRHPINEIVWGLFTGGYSYQHIFKTSFAPGFLFRLLATTLRHKFRSFA